jgi:hypothetical protein
VSPPPPPPVGGGGGGTGAGGGNVAPDRFEVNDTSDQPTGMGAVISTTQTFTGLSIDRHANGFFDQDWFHWTTSVGGTFNVSLTNISAGGGDLHVRVFRLNGNNTLTELGNGTQVGGFTQQGTSVPVTAGEDIYVWVYGFNFVLGTYDLNCNVI